MCIRGIKDPSSTAYYRWPWCRTYNEPRAEKFQKIFDDPITGISRREDGYEFRYSIVDLDQRELDEKCAKYITIFFVGASLTIIFVLSMYIIKLKRGV